MALDLTSGPITRRLLRFAFPIICGNLLQQFYNIADTLIVGRFLGRDALAAVGSSYTLMTFLTSILLGLCMGSGVSFSLCYGQRDFSRMKAGILHAFLLILLVTLALNGFVFWKLSWILEILQVPPEVKPLMGGYLFLIFFGIIPTFLYNFCATLLRAVGNSSVPLLFLGISAILNILLDLAFVLIFRWGVEGAAAATVLAQIVSGVGILCYTLIRFPEFRIHRQQLRWQPAVLKEIFQLSFLTCIQQSVMNLGILLVQGLINSFGPLVMAAFAAAVKIDSFAYMPVQDFGNAFSTFVAQNYGAQKENRVRQGIRSAGLTVLLFSGGVSLLVCLFARPLMGIFISAAEQEVIAIGVEYLRIEGAFYLLIGILFLLYGYYRAIKRPGVSVILTVLSLGTRVILAYLLSAIPSLGATGIWISVPVGWLLADLVGIFYDCRRKTRLNRNSRIPL